MCRMIKNIKIVTEVNNFFISDPGLATSETNHKVNPRRVNNKGFITHVRKTPETKYRQFRDQVI